MAKPKVVQGEQAHRVSVQEGAQVAQRKSTQKVATEKEQNQPKPAVKTRTTPITPRPVARLTPRPPVIPPPQRVPAPAASPTPETRTSPNQPSAQPVWAPDDAVLIRIHALRDRNALLADQLDRLAGSKR